MLPNCSSLFEKLRGYSDAVDESSVVAALFASLDADLPADRTMHWDMYIAEKELHGALEFVLKDKCADILARVP